ncbi:MAG: hypothetical protein QG657_451 [Acidobacteriota bacterium]|nr:hypothetical protein [Acidobacteriota bacterium]
MEKQKAGRRPKSSLSVDIETKISMLVSSIYYFLDFVYIIAEGERFRLVVMHNKKLLTYRTYKTLSAARGAFSRLYGAKAWKEGLKPNWSVFYHPAAKWLNERKKVIDKGIHIA